MTISYVSAWNLDGVPHFVKTPFVALGGTCLLAEFFNRIGSSDDVARLWICAPYIEDGIDSQIQLLGAMRHEFTEISVLTSNDENAQVAHEVLGRYRWRNRYIGVLKNFHAKVYAYSSARPLQLALFGSHNLTVGGLSRNFEAGILLASTGKDELNQPIAELFVTLEQQLRASRKTNA